MAVHSHDHGPGDLRHRQRRVLVVAILLNGVLMLAEAAGGIAFGSLALLADAAHMLSDVAGLGIALVAQSLITRPSSARHSYGLQRAEVLGAQVNGVVLVATAGWIIIEAIRRLDDAPPVQGAGLLVVAVVGLAVNLGSAGFLARVRGGSLNLHGAWLHMLADAAGSVAAVAAGIAALAWQAYWVDPVVSLLLGALVLWPAWRLLRDTMHVLLEGAPAGIDPGAVAATIAACDGVADVHHLHLWSLASDVPALSAHVVLEGELSMHEAQEQGDKVREVLAERFSIAHATLELECHACESGHGHDA